MGLRIIFILFALGFHPILSAQEECAPQVALEGLIATSRARYDALKELQKQGTTLVTEDARSGKNFTDKAFNPNLIFKGVPRSAIFITAGKKVFRHYRAWGPYFANGIRESALSSAVTSYIQVSPGLERRIFDDLNGLFLTTAEFTPESIGLPKGEEVGYIDLVLPEEMPVIQLETGIFLVPFHKQLPDWLREECSKLARGEAIPGYLEETCRKIVANGEHLSTSPRIPVTIVSHGKYDGSAPTKASR